MKDSHNMSQSMLVHAASMREKCYAGSSPRLCFVVLNVAAAKKNKEAGTNRDGWDGDAQLHATTFGL